MGRVTVLQSEDLRAIAVAAGSADPREIIYHEPEGQLEIPDVDDQAVLDAALASVLNRTGAATDEAKTRKIEALSGACESAIENGFQSDALGLHATAHWYDSARDDQMNLMGNVEVGDDPIHPHRATQSGPKIYTLHTNAQLRAVLKDGRDIKSSHLQAFAIKKAAAFAAVTMADLDAIVWP